MPELSRFYGIVIRMYMEAAVPHHLPHFHAYYQDAVGVYGLEPIDLIAGSLPRRQQRLVEAWAPVAPRGTNRRLATAAIRPGADRH